jgi:hypothetical protein
VRAGLAAVLKRQLIVVGTPPGFADSAARPALPPTVEKFPLSGNSLGQGLDPGEQILLARHPGDLVPELAVLKE